MEIMQCPKGFVGGGFSCERVKAAQSWATKWQYILQAQGQGANLIVIDPLLERKDGYWFWKEIAMRCKTYKTDGAVNTDLPPYTSAVD